MKKNHDILSTCATVSRVGNKILNIFNNIVLILVFLFGCYALMDTWAIVKGAGVHESLLQYRPSVEDGQSENPSIQELSAIYPDVKAWLTIIDTTIDFPIAQSTNNQKYVNMDIEGNFSLSGSIFLDYRSSADFSDFYTLLYGHHMDMQAMFGALDLFYDEEYLESHTEAYMFLTNKTEQIEIFAIISVDAYDEIVFEPFKRTDEEKQEIIDYIKEKASVHSDIELDINDRIVAFSTCSSQGTNARTIVFGHILD